MTSVLTYYEVEEAIYGKLSKSISGITHRKRYLIPAVRSVMTQVLITIKLYQIEVLDLTQTIIEEQIKNIDLQVEGIRAADSLHITTATLNNAEIILSADDSILSLDSKLQNISGVIVRCLDSDAVLTII